MIEPFEPTQIKQINGRPVVSFGTSSYGYDIRCSDEFKLFTDINTTIVDPKNFDPKSFVDVKGDFCIIPPNSFALARTVEYLRVPRNVLVLCLGKSTYARCFRGDTRVALVDGTAPTLEEMARRAQNGELFWGYSIGPTGRLIVTLLDVPRYVGRDALLEVVLDNGLAIHATHDHLFLKRDGIMAAADRLRPGDSLMPLYRSTRRGYEMVYQPINGHLYPTHRLSDEWNLRHQVYADEPGTHRHHIDHNRRNNCPVNLERKPAAEHIRLHNSDTYGADFDAFEHGTAIRSALERLAQDPEWVKRFSRAQADRATAFWQDERYLSIRERVLESRRNPSQQTRERHRAAALRRYSDAAERERHGRIGAAAWARDDGTRRERQRDIARQINLREEITAEAVRRALDEAGSVRGAARLLGCDRSVFRRFPEVLGSVWSRGQRNHKIVSIRALTGEHDVFCLTVPEAGNFALEAGVFVHNCGIIVNVTPLEPEWEGYVTLEFSNTTPLPAKIYANEGVAQVVFLEAAADDVCETSYKDRGGKYQGQTGVTLPKI